MGIKNNLRFFFVVCFVLLLTIWLGLSSTVFGASGDYIFNGETVPAKSWRTDTFYGVDTIRNVLDALEISYTDTTLVAYTHYANKFMKFYRSTYDENATALNMCIAKTSSGTATTFAIIPSNGSFSDSLPYAYVNEKASTGSYVGVNAFVNWNYNTNTGAIIGANNTNIACATISASNYKIGNSRVTVYTTTEDYQQEGNLYYKNLLSPIRTFAVAGNTNETGYSWYFLTNTIEFSATAGEDESGDSGGGSSGGTGGNVDLTITNQKIDELNRHAEEIKNKIPTSGEISDVISGETNKVLEFLSGDANFSGETISSGEIIASIGYTPPDDPYANFWWELTNIINNSLTGTKRTLTLESVKNTYVISIDDIGWNPPEPLRIFLTLLSTTCVVIILAKFIKITIDKMQSGSIDELLAMNEETGIVDLF